jgi:hypothetical protein
VSQHILSGMPSETVALGAFRFTCRYLERGIRLPRGSRLPYIYRVWLRRDSTGHPTPLGICLGPIIRLGCAPQRNCVRSSRVQSSAGSPPPGNRRFAFLGASLGLSAVLT